jgi:hypothetical protein
MKTYFAIEAQPKAGASRRDTEKIKKQRIDSGLKRFLKSKE